VIEFQLNFKYVTFENDVAHAFITKIKMDIVKRLLANKNYSISDIAFRIGLSKHDLLIQFKKHTGKSPSAWRRDENDAFGGSL
jgi:AraC-like DNA-binding protein